MSLTGCRAEPWRESHHVPCGPKQHDELRLASCAIGECTLNFKKNYFSAVLFFLLTVTTSVRGQSAMQCVANAGVPPIVRSTGLTELVSDLTLNCTGGSPTPAGQTIPQFNITLLLNTNATSRLLTTTGLFTEALLIIDEPASCGGAYPAYTQLR